jgi:rhamnopyranosyl-N-acetylglucosaminyl-diphospho-decaprenol beta-1,3/1,4-galactofuranosyltransferase
MNRDAPNIAAVFATMNRSHVAVACVKALAAQTRPPGRVIVADNRSADGTAEDLEALGHLPFALKVLRMPENEGNAGGVRAAMDLAFAEGAGAVWILDDDSWPRPDALEKILDLPWDGKTVRHPLQIDPETGVFSWPMLTRSGDGPWRLASSMEELEPGATSRNHTCWTGALLPREVYLAVGPVNGELFIRGEDEEYPWRIREAGYAFEAVHASVMDHPGPANMVVVGCLGKRFFFEKNLPDWKLHYKVRNMVWLKRRQSGGAKAILTALAYALAALRFDGPARLPLVARAALEGWQGILGRIP